MRAATSFRPLSGAGETAYSAGLLDGLLFRREIMLHARRRLTGARRRSRERLLYRAIPRAELLEPRRLLSSTLDDNGLLTAIGTSGDDDLRVDRSGKTIIVTLNGVRDGAFDRKDVSGIVLNGLDGDDTLRIG